MSVQRRVEVCAGASVSERRRELESGEVIKPFILLLFVWIHE